MGLEVKLNDIQIAMRYIKKAPHGKNIVYLPKSREKPITTSIVSTGSDAYIRYGNFSHEIIDGKNTYVFPPDKKKVSEIKTFRKGMFLFKMVRDNAKAWLKKHPRFRLPKQYPVNQYKKDYQYLEDKITATDLNNAYWTIAVNMGIISKKTYEKGLEDYIGFKTIRLASLSTLGAGKTYYRIKDGEITDDEVNIGSDKRLAEVYKLIRYTCFRYMNDLKVKLGKDFVAYRTDCIYYRDTPENRKMVTDYLKSKSMNFKQLYGDRVQRVKKMPPVQTDGNDEKGVSFAS